MMVTNHFYTCMDTLRILSVNQEFDEMPHYDTLNDYPDCLADIRKKMITSLIRGK